MTRRDSAMGPSFREKLYDPTTRPMGMFVKLPTIETIEMLAIAGFDLVIIDLEHAPISIETCSRMIATAELAGMAALVRVRGHDIAGANTLLDAGASGILVPHASPCDTVRTLMAGMLFPPRG